MSFRPLLLLLSTLLGTAFAVNLQAAASTTELPRHIQLGLVRDNPYHSAMAKVVVQAYKNLGIEVELLPLPGKRSLKLSNRGLIDGEVARIEGLEQHHQELIPIPVVLGRIRGMVVTHNYPDFVVNGWQSLIGYRVAAPLGAFWSEQAPAELKLQYVDTASSSMTRMLEQGYSDFALIGSASKIEALRRSEGKLRVLEPALIEYPFYHYLNRSKQKLAEAIHAELQRMRLDGSLSKLRDRYFYARPTPSDSMVLKQTH